MAGAPRLNKTIDDLIRRFVIEDISSGCWEWQGSKHVQGYSLCRFKGKMHRVERLFKMDAEGIEEMSRHDRVMNLCGNSNCVNPDHYEIRPRGTYDYPFKGQSSRFSAEEANKLKEEWDSIPEYHGKRKHFKEKYQLSDCMMPKITSGTYKASR